jgi:peptide/nickel transport system ATP-binding protein
MQSNTLLRVEGLKKWFPISRGLFRSFISKELKYIKAVDGVDFEVKKGEIFGLVGESGCGKTTLARTILRLIEPTEGKIIFKGKDITSLKKEELRKIRRELQFVFQDPYESLNPYKNIFSLIAEPLRIHKIVKSDNELKEKVMETLNLVELAPPEKYMYKYPHELSGGERQRVAIGRALALQPDLIIEDEPVSMLDVSIRAQILDLLLKLRNMFGTSQIYITHDIATAKYMCDRIAVMYLGKIVEMGPVNRVIDNPLHPYTKALISAIPRLYATQEYLHVQIIGEILTIQSTPTGCRFHPRCPLYASEHDRICKEVEPKLRALENSEHYVACHKV